MKKVDCLLLHIPLFEVTKHKRLSFFVNFISMGLFSMSTELAKKGFNPQILHLGLEKNLDYDFDIAEYIKINNIKIVGLSLHWHFQAYDSISVAKYIKEKNPDVFIFMGGYTSSAFALEIMENYDFIDAVIKGEGEKPLVELISKLKESNKNFSRIPNLYWRKNGQIKQNAKVWFANKNDLNNFSFNGLKYLLHSDIYLKMPIKIKKNKESLFIDYLNEKKLFIECLGRGCPGNCTWCGGGFEAVKYITGRDKISIRNPEIVAEEIFAIKKQYKIDCFYICYDPYPDNQNYILDLFELLGKRKRNKINIIFECFGLPSKNFIDSFKKNLGSKSQIVISPEFGDETLRKIHKAFYYSNDELIERLNYIKEKKIKCLLYFTQTPFEKVESLNCTNEFTKRLRDEFGNNEKFQIVIQKIKTYEPYSPWVLNPDKYGVNPDVKTFSDYYNKYKDKGINYF